MLAFIGIGVLAVAIFVTGYLVGSNNPYEAARKKIIQKAQDAINKIKNA